MGMKCAFWILSIIVIIIPYNCCLFVVLWCSSVTHSLSLNSHKHNNQNNKNYSRTIKNYIRRDNHPKQEQNEIVSSRENWKKKDESELLLDEANRTLSSLRHRIDNPNSHFSTKSFTNDMAVLAKLVSQRHGAQYLMNTIDIATDILERLEEVYLQNEDMLEHQLDSIAYNAVANAWAKSKRKDAGERVENILNHMEDLEYTFSKQKRSKNQSHLVSNIRPCTITFNTAISAWANNGEVGAIERSESLLKRMVKRFNSGDLDCKPDAITYSSLIDVYSSVSDLNTSTFAAERAEEVLTRMEDLYMAGDCEVKPNIYTFCSVIDVWTKSNAVDAAYKAESLLNRAIDYYEMNGDEDFRPNVVILSAAISAWVKRITNGKREENKIAIDKIEQIFEQMKQLQVAPNVFTYSAIISAYAKVGNIRKAESLFFDMESRFKDGDQNVRPNAYTYSSMISALAKSGNNRCTQKAVGMLKKMEDLYERGEFDMQPNVFTFSAVMQALSRSSEKDKISKMIELLHYMKKSYESGNKAARPTTVIYNQILVELSRSNWRYSWKTADQLVNEMREDKIGFDSLTFSSIIVTHMKGSYPGSDKKVEHLLNEAKLCRQADVICYNAYLRTLARSRGGILAAKKAESILSSMLSIGSNVDPDKITFNTVLDAWAKSGHRSAGEEGERLLRIMLDKYNEGNFNLKPDVVTYSTIIDAYSKSRDPLSAERLLNEMVAQQIPPDLKIYNVLIQAWAYSNENGKARRAMSIINHIGEGKYHGEDQVFSRVLYNSALQACALTNSTSFDETEEAKSISSDIFSKLEDSQNLKPNEVIYGTMLKTVGNLWSDKDRDYMLRQVFNKCKETGYVDARVTTILMNAAGSVHLLNELLERKGIDNLLTKTIDFDSLPSQWSRRVKRKSFKTFHSKADS